jgi:hypothetical protein
MMDSSTERFAAAVACLGQFLGMDAENRDRQANGLAAAYASTEFEQVAERYGLPVK